MLAIDLSLSIADLRLRTQLYMIWLISYWLRAALARLGRSGQPTLLGVQIVLRRVLIDRTTGRELCEDPVLVKSWFELVEQIKATYGICDEDIYNFDGAGSMMGKITTQLVVKGLEGEAGQRLSSQATASG